MLSLFINITKLNFTDDVISKHQSSFNIIQRIIFILSIILIFWIVFILIYIFSRLIIRFLSNLKRSKHDINTKVCQTFVISSSNQYGSFNHSNTNFSLINEKLNNSETIHLTINHHTNLQSQQIKTTLLEHYLKTYNPLQIDLTNNHHETITTSNVKVISDEEFPSETDTYPVDNCYLIHCTNKQRFYQSKRYARLKEQENCSTIMSMNDDRLSECSTKLTSTTLPIIMITDCSNSKRLHTDIIEMNEDE